MLSSGCFEYSRVRPRGVRSSLLTAVKCWRVVGRSMPPARHEKRSKRRFRISSQAIDSSLSSPCSAVCRISRLGKLPEMPMLDISLTVNGHPVKATVEARTQLSELLREELNLTGTHVGCEQGVCGACTVFVDGKPQRSCINCVVRSHVITGCNVAFARPEC